MNEGYEIIDMDKPPEKEDIKPKNTEWKQRKSSNGRKILYKKHDDKFVNIGFFKNGRMYITYDGKFIRHHRLKYENDKQIKQDVDELMRTVFYLFQ